MSETEDEAIASAVAQHTTHSNPSAPVQAERAQHESQATFSSFYAATPFNVGMIEAEGDDFRLLFGDHSMAKIEEDSRGGKEGISIREVGAPEEVVDLWISRLKEIERTGKPQRFEFMYPADGEGGVLHIRAYAAQVGYSQGRARFVFAVEDITESKRIEAKMRDSDDRTRDFFDSLTDGFIAYNRQWRIIYANGAAAVAARLPREAIAGKVLWELFPQTVGSAYAAACREAMNEGIPTHREDYWPRYDVWFESHIFPIHDGVAVMFRDITKRKQAEVMLSRQAQLLELAHDTILTHDLDNRIIFWNRNAEQMYGWSREAAVGKVAYNLLQTRFPVSFEAVKAALLDTGEWEGELIQTRRDGEQIISASRWALQRDSAGVPIASLEINRDITRQRAEEKERARLTEEIANHRKRMDDLIASVPGVVWEMWGQPDTASLRIDYVSPYVEVMLGYTVNEWLSTPNFWLTIVHPDDRDRAASTWAEAWAGASEHTNEFRWIATDGQVIPVEAHAVVIRDAEGRPVGMRGVTLDVSERQRASEALRRSEARLAGIISSATEAIISLDDQQRIIVFNHAAEGMFGCPAEQALGGSIDRFIPERFRTDHRQHIRDFGQTGVTIRSMTSLQPLAARRVNGEEFPIEATISQEKAGGQQLYTVIIRDITQRQRAEAELQALNERLRRAMMETHHRVKNNLQVIAAMVDLQVMEDTERLPVSEFRRLGLHVRTLAAVHDILTDQARLEGTAETVSAKVVLERLFTMLRTTIGNCRLQFTIEDAPLSTRQATALALLANELTSNAGKYGRGEVEITFNAGRGMATLIVDDDGPGFPPDFDWRTAANTGLGLIDSAGRYDLRGTISYENRPAGGARVKVTFPLSAPSQMSVHH